MCMFGHLTSRLFDQNSQLPNPNTNIKVVFQHKYAGSPRAVLKNLQHNGTHLPRKSRQLMTIQMNKLYNFCSFSSVLSCTFYYLPKSQHLQSFIFHTHITEQQVSSLKIFRLLLPLYSQTLTNTYDASVTNTSMSPLEAHISHCVSLLSLLLRHFELFSELLLLKYTDLVHSRK